MRWRLVYYLFTASMYIIGAAELVSGKPARDIKLEQSIRSYYLKNYPRASSDSDFILKYFPVYTDLNGDGKREAVVYIFGDCGSMACPLQIATPTKKGYRVISELRPVHTPIWVSNKRNNGWHNIVVMQGGTANDRPFRSAFRFDGKSYVADPNDTGKRGKLLIGNNIGPLDGIPLKIKAK